MLNELTITVTPEDISYGLPGSPASCPLARAIKRTFGALGVGVEVKVDEMVTLTHWWTRRESGIAVVVRDEMVFHHDAMTFIEQFDTGNLPFGMEMPLTFHLTEEAEDDD